MEERTAEEVAQIFSAAGDSVTLINTDTAKVLMKRNRSGKIELKGM
ncbi:MAG: hypothetical protein CM15mV80_060 [uncultured marine virus]|nr:MAG: hypothetical protein CM15mV80_060 [uncultured marine virus]